MLLERGMMNHIRDKLMETNIVKNMDCLEFMKSLPDKCIDLCLTDPPYGISNKPLTGFKKGGLSTKEAKKSYSQAQLWDKKPDRIYFDEMIRVSKFWVIWGGNYFADYLGACKEPYIWNKKTGGNYFADGEMAFTNGKGTLRIFDHQWCGALKDSERGQQVHPTQKPTELFSWCINKIGKGKIKTVIDPFAGSGTTAISCINLGLEYILVEKEKEYFDIINKRISKHLDGNLFTMETA